MSQTIIKPWGREVILTTPDSPYTAKILYLNASYRLSLQYHDQKTETLTLYSGQAKVIQGKERSHLEIADMELLHGYTFKPMIIHRIEALSDCIFLETSTPENGTTFRLEDDQNRPNETETIRNSTNRGWQNPHA